MGTIHTARDRISMVRSTIRKAVDQGVNINKRKFEAQIVLSGSTRRHARETIQVFIDAGEIKLGHETQEINGVITQEVILIPNMEIYGNRTFN